jgi:hypothetical protein
VESSAQHLHTNTNAGARGQADGQARDRASGCGQP